MKKTLCFPLRPLAALTLSCWIATPLALAEDPAPEPEPAAEAAADEEGAEEGEPVDLAALLASLVGTEWRLEDLCGRGVVDDSHASLEFGEDGAVFGRGSVNRFRGAVRVVENQPVFGPLASTLMAGPPALMHQETAYLRALDKAEGLERKVEEGQLLIHVADEEEPLRFILVNRDEEA